MSCMIKKAAVLSKVYDTGENPLLITGEDLEDYICKHEKRAPSNKLFNELIANEFLRRFEIRCVEYEFFEVSYELFEEFKNKYTKIDKSNFDLPMIGFKVLNGVVDDSNENNVGNRFVDKIDVKEILFIALFDIWISNDDRVLNNHNILLKKSTNEDKIELYAIDHSLIFNGNALDRGIFEIDYEGSILSSTAYGKIIKKLNDDKFEKLIQEIEQDFYIYADKCSNDLNEILKKIPVEWKINITIQENELRKKLLTQEWQESVVEKFKELISLTRQS